jgi:tripartite motif-containing protein 71
MMRTSAITKPVLLPESKSLPTFDSKLHAVVAKTSSGGYEVRSASQEEAQVFSSTGQLEETRLSSVSPEVTAQSQPAFPAFVESLGSEGKENGQFAHPADAAVDSKGDLWVVDKNNNRVEEFNEAGEFVRSAGSYGSGAGQLSSPAGVAMDSSGNVDVTDTTNNRVVRFNEKGEFVSTIGANVNKTKVESGGTLAEKNHCTATSGNVCQAGTSGSVEGLMSEPIGITTTAGGNFLVVEKANNRVEKFNTSGELLAKFGSTGSEAGQLKEPTAIASSSIGGGYFWVADTGNNRIEEWTTSYAFVRAVGKEGTGEAQFKQPAAIEADAEGNVYVGDQGNERIQELSKSGDFVTRFGSEGQFSFDAPMGIVLDSTGDLWVTDSERDVVQKWLTGSLLFTSSHLGSNGTGNGQFAHPADAAVDSKGNLWALDRGNNRIEEFNEKGEYATSVGSQGSTGGKLSSPAGLAIDPSGNLWVADTANNRVEEFNEKGEFVITFGREVNKTKVEAKGTEAEKNVCTAASGNICQAGVTGSAGGQFKAPQGIAATSGGNLWIADTGNSRLEKFGPSGNLINNISSEGTEAGKLKEPGAISMGPEGSIWVADTANNRIDEWSSSLAFVQQFGSEGAGNGQFKRPAALDLDSSGNVWVGDQNNERLQEFTSAGQYVAQLGGSATQFSFSSPMGLSADGKGNIWVTDPEHNRVERFPTSQFADPLITEVPTVDYTYSSGLLSEMDLEESEGDPSMSLTNSSGLTTGVSSEAGSASYSYSSGNLTSEKDPEGETKYERDASNRLTKITLPNGTWASIVYDSSSRATEVTVKPAGKEEKTTHLWYGLEPRETKVWGGGEPEVIYSVTEDGSVFKWAYAEIPPTIEEPSGSLWSSRGKEVEKSKAQTLVVNASSSSEISSIKIVANGNAVVEETTCEDNSVPPAHNCDKPPALEWTTSPSEHAAGQLDLEIIATDFNGNSSAKSFYVTMPQEEEAESSEFEPPTFESTKLFREEYGLDRSKSLTQPELNKLVLELLYEWEVGNSTAVAAVNSWGVPMRAAELGEMEYRREYMNRAAEVIPLWAEEHAAESYGGFYVDDRAGGIIYVGFTENQQSLVESLKQDSRLINPGAIHEFPTPPTRSWHNLETTIPSVESALTVEGVIGQVTSIGVASSGSLIRVGSTSPSVVTEAIQRQLGVSAPIVVEAGSPLVTFASRYEARGPIVAGAGLVGANGHACTAGYSARAGTGKQNRGQEQYLYFILTAGHCFPNGTVVGRATSRNGEGIIIGKMRRNGFNSHPASDGGGVLVDENLRSHSVLNGDPLEAQPIQGDQPPQVGRKVCWSGERSGHHCGMVKFHTQMYEESTPIIVYVVAGLSMTGDSGGPVWDPETHKAVGLITGGTPEFGKCWKKIW